MTEPDEGDLPDMNVPWPDLGHEAIRQFVLAALAQYAAAVRESIDDRQALHDALDALTARVTALEPQPTPPDPAPAPVPDPPPDVPPDPPPSP